MTHTEAVNTLASERYLLNEMTEPERDAFEAHFFECETCADDVTTGTLMTDGARAGFVAGPKIARVAAFTPAPKRIVAAAEPAVPHVVAQAWYRSSALPWAVAATLAVMVGYQAQRSVGISTPAAGPVALTAVALRPASRGSAPRVSVAGSHVALALDLDSSGGTDVSYELREANGAVITSGRAPAPTAGSPLLLVIPTFTLKGQQQYILSVRDVANPQRPLGDFPFAATP